MGIQLRGKKVGRNDLCPCKSGLKSKYCHADNEKKAIVNTIANEAMAELIFQERIKQGLICEHGISTDEKCIDCSGPQEIILED